MKQQVDVIDATPSKRLYRSIIVDYDLNTAIAELIDNAIDAWVEQRGGPDLLIQINIDVDQQSFLIKDNAGGVGESDLKNLISPGQTTSDGSTEIIGIFGVGSKRAAVVLSQLISITTRRHRHGTFRLEYDEDWLDDAGNWQIPYHRVNEIEPSSTIIDLSKLRFKIDEAKLKELREYLAATYCYILKKYPKISIKLNDGAIVGEAFDNWAYPPGFAPRCIKKRLSVGKNKAKVSVKITAGLVLEKEYEHGAYFYCNGRLISRAFKSDIVGFEPGRAGHHASKSLARIIIELDGPSREMPWNSSKSAINFNSPVFIAVRDDVLRASETYSKLSQRLFEKFEEKVLPFKEGSIEVINLQQDEVVKPSRLPNIPKVERSYKEQIISLNVEIGQKFPWARGLYEAIIAEELISRQAILKQSKRLSVIILDSTIEIAFKDFLAWHINQPLGDKRLAELFENRIEVHREVRKHLQLDASTWKKIDYFYKLRCDLVHRKVSAEVSSFDLEEFRGITKLILSQAFGMRFP